MTLLESPTRMRRRKLIERADDTVKAFQELTRAVIRCGEAIEQALMQAARKMKADKEVDKEMERMERTSRADKAT